MDDELMIELYKIKQVIPSSKGVKYSVDDILNSRTKQIIFYFSVKIFYFIAIRGKILIFAFGMGG
jgi:hypothetical protein